MPRAKRATPDRRIDFLLVGGGVACASAAETLRLEGAQGSILMLCGEPVLPYARNSLSALLRQAGSVGEPTPVLSSEYCVQHRVEVMLGVHASAVDAHAQRVTTYAGQTFLYEHLLIATGAAVKRLNIPGADLAGIYYLRTAADAKALHARVRAGARAVVIGASFIGMELAATLRQCGMEVTLLVRESRVFDTLHDARISEYFHALYTRRGVTVHFDEAVRFEGSPGGPQGRRQGGAHGGAHGGAQGGAQGEPRRRAAAGATGEAAHVGAVVTASGRVLPCDLVAVGVGVSPQVAFLKDSGIALGDGVLVDAFLRTNHANVFAAGDVANFSDVVFNVRRRVEHWDNAIKQGRTAARNMLGHRLRYDEVSYFFGELFDTSYQFFGMPLESFETREIGALSDQSCALLYLQDNMLRAVFTTGRPAAETHALQSLIRFRTHAGKWLHRLDEPGFNLSEIPAQTVLILQGGGALGAFEWGVTRAMEEARICADIVAGVSIGAFNGAIIASHPGEATAVLKSFWHELAVLTTELPNKQAQQLLTSWEIFTLGVPAFFRPRWLNARTALGELPGEWTYLYDPEPMKSLLLRHVDFAGLKSSPVRLLISAVDVESGVLRVFDSYVDDLTPEHIIASGSLPLALPWTTIAGRHYWDGGIVSNSPLDQVIDRCGAYGKQIYIVDLFPQRKPLPRSLIEVIARRDEIVYAERMRQDTAQRQLVLNYRKLVDEAISHVPAPLASQLRQRPRYIELMGDDHDQRIVRIVRQDARGAPPSRDYDFSLSSILRLQRAGYRAARRVMI